jgi:hypothetical protein
MPTTVLQRRSNGGAIAAGVDVVSMAVAEVIGVVAAVMML